MKFNCKSISYLFLISTLAVFSCKNNETDKKEMAIQENQNKVKLLIGMYTDSVGKGIYEIAFDQESGNLGEPQLLVATENPSFLTQSTDGNFVYAVNENQEGSLSAFQWNADKTKLDLLSQHPSAGAHPCYISLSGKQDLIAAANYSSGDFVVYNRLVNGNLDSIAQIKKHTGSGPVKPNQEAAHAHCAIFSKNQKHLYIADLGIDEIAVYNIDEQNQVGDKMVALALDKGDGPRHMIFHPTGNFAFVINELSSSVVSVKVDAVTGIFTTISKVSTLPPNYSGRNACADIHISDDGKFLYASNRGHNSIATIAIDDLGGLKTIAQDSVMGDWPRNFMISPNNKFILVANQLSNNITVFERNENTGLLRYTDHQIGISKPVYLSVKL
ncbi:MAG TPA: lactonase family protein [Saprospiraceae bacterium]|nr:lactonase family protein [Saprospiraceae bacterium]HPN69972.1 lactonase family protein [Saprospiraceae bacterium]